ncbi:hypothetical protein QCA50_011219 [Cerrena zonata]|uniref:Uncharacterized protein n=1 Tax=Cerrena zonata TaxID=2478898 RepID=A0AAW0G7W9_9APHY
MQSNVYSLLETWTGGVKRNTRRRKDRKLQRNSGGKRDWKNYKNEIVQNIEHEKQRKRQKALDDRKTLLKIQFSSYYRKYWKHKTKNDASLGQRLPIWEHAILPVIENMLFENEANIELTVNRIQVLLLTSRGSFPIFNLCTRMLPILPVEQVRLVAIFIVPLRSTASMGMPVYSLSKGLCPPVVSYRRTLSFSTITLLRPRSQDK